MSVLELKDEQVISIVRQLPAARKRTALLALAQDAQARREERIRFGEAGWIEMPCRKMGAKSSWMPGCTRNNRGPYRRVQYQHPLLRDGLAGKSIPMRRAGAGW